MSATANLLFELFLTLFDSLLAVYFLSRFVYASLKNWWAPGAALLLIATQSYFDFLCPIDLPVVIPTLIQLSIALGYALLVCRKQYFRAICGTIIHKLLLIGVTTLLITVISYFYDFDSFMTFGIGGARIVVCLMQKLILFLIYIVILHFCDRESRGKPLYFLFLVFFAISSIVAEQLIVNVTANVASKTLQIALSLVAGMILLLNLVLYVMLGVISKLEKERYQLALFSEQERFEQRKYQEALDLYQNAEKLRHDVKHHIGVLSTMLEDGNTAECKAYIEKYFSTIGKKPRFSPSGNRVVDYLLESKFALLTEIEITITGSATALSDIPAPELASILGNIIDNAIEAQEEVLSKRIALYFGSQNNNRVIVCKNTIKQSVIENNRLLNSSKGHGHHGMGHRIVEEIVEKHHGYVNYSEEEDMFCVTIVLPMTEN